MTDLNIDFSNLKETVINRGDDFKNIRSQVSIYLLLSDLFYFFFFFAFSIEVGSIFPKKHFLIYLFLISNIVNRLFAVE